MDKCASKPMTNDIYVCLSEESSILNKQYEESFKNLLIKIKNEKKFVINFNDLNNDLSLSKKKWESWIDAECLTEADVYQKETRFYASIYDMCMIKNYTSRIDYYNNFKFN
ncbi:DUF1311 domain-containing protein [Rosenbergiella australiborealis]|uniref:DUF1311 domain-containing protein n=1 Tax=Rosenbergiella australiborealis TaxID=1544696 RepID=A0ABS5T839_9GAMM|nr:lysozyme inhibitor LprI family protein [Rosenbergiella australiborealis]MBT0728494.1 DUF1311 domain-containing protein [Rosenbergiella australiborealis]